MALAATQGLYEKVEEKETQIDALQQHNSDLEKRITTLQQYNSRVEKRLAAMEALLSKTEGVEVFSDEASALAK